MQQRVTPPKANQNEWTAQHLLEQWSRYLQDHDRSAGTVKKYTQAVSHFLTWYEHEEHSPLILSSLTPIALIGYRNALQHEQRKSKSTVNLQVSALRSWCGWMTEQGYLAADPAAHVKLVGGEGSTSRTGLKSSQVNALIRYGRLSATRIFSARLATSPVAVTSEIRIANSSPPKRETVSISRTWDFSLLPTAISN